MVYWRVCLPPYGFTSVGLPLSATRSQLLEYLTDFSINALLAPQSIINSLSGSNIVTIHMESVSALSNIGITTTPPIGNPPPLPDSLLYTIILTSGTTAGKSKGVLYTREAWKKQLIVHQSDTLRGISYLPLAHIVDRHHVAKTMFNGGEIVIVDPLHCLFETGTLATIRPTILFTTPNLASELLAISDEDKAACIQSLSTVVCGGGTLQSNIIDSLERELYVKVINPYGLTDIGNIAINGKMLPSIRYKLIPIIDDTAMDNALDWDHDSDQSSIYGVDELAVFVGSDFNGYDNKTAGSTSVVDRDGYFLTGDIVRVSRGVHHDNSISGDIMVEVLGRVGKSVKLASGEWIAPSVIEDVITSIMHEGNPISRDVFVDVSLSGKSVICVLCLTHSVSLLTNAEVMTLINIGLKDRGLHSVSRIVRCVDRFTVENGLRNDGLKLARRALRERFAHVFEADADEMDVVSTTVGYLASGLTFSRNDSIGKTSFRNLGGDSLLALQVKRRLVQDYNIDNNSLVRLLLQSEISLASIREQLNQPSSAHRSVESVNNQIFLFAEEIRNNLEKQRNVDRSGGVHHAEKCMQTVLVTGASGFIGMHVVRDIQRRHQQAADKYKLRVICLVRQSSQDTAIDLFKEFCGVEILGGDISAPKFGLSDEVYSKLGSDVTCIIHCSGNTNQSLPCEDLMDNPKGVMEVLRFGSTVRRCPPHMVFLSTTDLLPNNTSEIFPLHLSENFDESRLSGYAQSKLKEEEAIEKAIIGGLRHCITICRLGLVCNSVSSNPWRVKDDFIDIVLSGVHRMQLAPDLPENVQIPQVVPVDTMAVWIVSLALYGGSNTAMPIAAPFANAACAVYHLCGMHSQNGECTNMSYASAFREFRLPITSLNEWKSSLVRGSALHNLNCAIDLFSQMSLASTPHVIDSSYTMMVLRKLESPENPSIRDIVESIRNRPVVSD